MKLKVCYEYVRLVEGLELSYIYANVFGMWQITREYIKMKVVLALTLLAALGEAVPSGGYTNKFDNVDLDEILSNDRLYKKYFDCLMAKGKCPPDGKQLKGGVFLLKYFFGAT